MAPENTAQEVLTIRGRLDRAGHFEPRRCASTTFVRRWPRTESSAYTIELLDRDERPLHRELALVEEESHCDYEDYSRFSLTAYIGLHEQSAAVQIRRDDIVIWRRAIPAKPTLEANLARQRLGRHEAARIRLRYSDPEKGAYMQVMYQWAPRRYRAVAILEPGPEIVIDLSEQPGGRECRFIVIYSNGLRATAAATRMFRLEPLGPSLLIVSPRPRTTLTTAQPLLLQGQVIDPERPDRGKPSERLTWWLDGREVGRGSCACIDRLKPGRRQIVLRYGDERDAVHTSTTVTVSESAHTPAHAWAPFNDWSLIER